MTGVPPPTIPAWDNCLEDSPAIADSAIARPIITIGCRAIPATLCLDLTMPAPICELTGRIYAGDRAKLKLKAESFSLLNRGNKRVQITEDGFMANAPEFVKTDKTIGINIFLPNTSCPSSLQHATDAYATRQIPLALKSIS